MVKKSALGRGLSNLIPGAERTSEGLDLRNNPEYQELEIDRIKPNPEQPRKRFTEQELAELATTIQGVGLIEPIVVRPFGDEFQIISGERRWRACQTIGYKKIPAIVKRVDDIQALEMGIIENIQREELTPIEEAKAYDLWIARTGMKPSQLAERVGKERTTVANLLRLLKLPDEVQEMLSNRMISAGQARPLIGIADRKVMRSLVERIVREGWSARRVEEEVGRLTEGDSGTGVVPKTGGKVDPNIRSLEDKIRAKYTAKVAIAHRKDESGKISIAYSSLDELDRILEMMGVKS